MSITDKGMIQVSRAVLLEQLEYWKERSDFYEKQLLKILELRDTITPKVIIMPLTCPHCKADLSETFNEGVQHDLPMLPKR